MELKTKERIVAELQDAIFLLRDDSPSVASWMCAVDYVQNVLPDMIMEKRKALYKYNAETALREVKNVEG